MTSAFSWQSSISLCTASFCTFRPNLPGTPGISLLVFIELFTLSFFRISGWGIDLDYCDIEWFALEMNRDHSVIFETAPKYCISDYFADYEGYPISSKEVLPTVLDIIVI